ncbi:MAG: hypothetical protein CM15mP16_06110 [Candidatus Pelagibacterales bacterium]|nr:MAG: hypothetical protein CM15mP16_06110 [Pelagibacterales bacterium]
MDLFKPFGKKRNTKKGERNHDYVRYHIGMMCQKGEGVTYPKS